MQLTDTARSYGLISIWLHWIGAAAMIALYVTGEGDEDLHVGLGMVLFVFLVARLFWRIGAGRPEKPAQHALLNLLSTIVVWALLAAVGILILTGPLLIWLNGEPIHVFRLSLASPLPRLHGAHEVMEGVHEVVGELVMPLMVLHVLGALKHTIFDRDGTLGRMLRPSVLKTPAR